MTSRGIFYKIQLAKLLSYLRENKGLIVLESYMILSAWFWFILTLTRLFIYIRINCKGSEKWCVAKNNQYRRIITILIYVII